MEIKIERISSKEARDIISRGMACPHDIERVMELKKKIENGWEDVKERKEFKLRHYQTPIVFKENGKLWEGKHRILALALSNSEGIDLVCVRNWPDSMTSAEYINGDKKQIRHDILTELMKRL